MNRFSTKAALRFLLDHVYISWNAGIYRQRIGIPMGTNCAPSLANLYLFYYERRFMLTAINSHRYAPTVKTLFSLCARFLDDILVLFDASIAPESMFRLFQLIYKETNIELTTSISISTSTSTTTTATTATTTAATPQASTIHFLDALLKLPNNIDTTTATEAFMTVYDKRNDYNFPITYYLSANSVVNIQNAYKVIIGQMIRYLRLTTDIQQLRKDLTMIVERFVKRGFSRVRLQKTIEKYCSELQETDKKRRIRRVAKKTQ